MAVIRGYNYEAVEVKRAEYFVFEFGGSYMKIGITRALLYQYYYPFWRSLFERLGCEVVISDTSTKAAGSKRHSGDSP